MIWLLGLMAADVVGRVLLSYMVWSMSVCIFRLSVCREGTQLCDLGTLPTSLGLGFLIYEMEMLKVPVLDVNTCHVLRITPCMW